MKYLKLLLLLTAYYTAVICSAAQQGFITGHDLLVNGYSSKVSGTDFDYHSCIPGLRESMLIRATGGMDFLEWNTDPAPREKEKDLAFIWIAAIGSSPGNAGMELSTQMGHKFIFRTDGRPDWTLTGADGSSLSFHSLLIDQHGDHHGYMILRIPAKQSVAGESLKIRVRGHRDGLTSWYMTFKMPVKTGITINTFPAIYKEKNINYQLIEAGIFYFGNKTEAKIYADKKLIATTTLEFGYNSVNTGLPEVSKVTKVNIEVIAGSFKVLKTIELQPVKKWEIGFVQHSHTDIGYTRSQTEILAEHLRYIDYALDFCDATDHYPDNARFRWTCEAAWPVDEYLKTRPAEQINRLLGRIREGRIEVTGMYFNFDELPDEQILASSLNAASRIKEKGIPISVAMQNDVNGIGWCLNDYYNTLGVKYLNMGTHGHRALICFDKPTLFWWESPSGKRMLAYRAEHYMTGNTVFEIQSLDLQKFRNNLLNYLKSLEGKNYPYNQISIQHSGYLTDNSPPSTSISDLIRQWDEKYVWPKLSTITAESFFREMEAKHGSEFQVIKGAWPDWWTDGFGASARETAAAREASVNLTAITGALSMASLAGIHIADETIRKTELADEALLFYTEHTAGYSESVREPFSLPTMEQRALKESYAWEANRRTASAGEDALGLLQSLFRSEKDAGMVVFNTLNWSRSGTTIVYIDHQLVPRGSVAGIFDKDGNRLPSQAVSHRSDGTYWMVGLSDIPGFGFKKYLVKPMRENAPVTDKNPRSVIENKWYRIVTDSSRAAAISWFDKELDLELLDHNSERKLGEFILEKLGTRSQMESRKLDDFVRLPLDSVHFDSYINGPVFESIRYLGESETFIGPGGFSIEFRLYHNEKKAEIICSVIKKSITDPESFYISFPFGITGGKHYTEVQGGLIETGRDQIPGSSNDWYTVQNFTTVKNNSSQVVLCSPDMPLMQFGAINTGRYSAGAMPQSTNLYSWPMNNYWVTNFNAEQRGGHTWSYHLCSSADNSAEFASRFGWGSRVPFLTRVLPGRGNGDAFSEGSLLGGWPSNIILVKARPAEKQGCVLLHIREVAGKQVRLELKGGPAGLPLLLQETDPSGKIILKGDNIVDPFESKFYLVSGAGK
jgi:hypothetical protein